MKSPTRLIFVRHGEVEASYHRVFGGRIDMELSPFGHDQAKAMAAYLERFPFDAIYASPMKRVQQTLTALVERQNKVAKVLPGLREVDFGAWTGMAWDQIQDKFGVSPFAWLDELEGGRIAHAEPVEHFRERVAASVQEILEKEAEKTVAVVCHGGVIRMALSYLLDLPLRKTAQFDIEYASVTMVDHLPGKSVIQLLNFTPWRDLA